MIQQIERGEIEPVYFLYGSERFLHTEILNALSNKLITPENRDFNLETFDTKSSSVNDWLTAAGTFSFLGGTKLVVVRNLHESTLNEKETKSLLDYLADPPPETCLVMTADKADRKKKIFKALTALKGAVECEAPSEGVLISWIKNRAQSIGYALSTDVARMMLDRIGPKPGILAGELEKVITFVGEKRTVSEKDVTEVVGDIRMENVFALTDALREKNAGNALGLLRNQIDHGEEPIKILGMIAWQFRIIWEVKHYQGKKFPRQKIAGLMGAKPFLVDKAMQYTKNFNTEQLRAGFENLSQADRALKTSGGDPQGIMESLVLKLCSG